MELDGGELGAGRAGSLEASGEQMELDQKEVPKAQAERVLGQTEGAPMGAGCAARRASIG